LIGGAYADEPLTCDEVVGRVLKNNLELASLRKLLERAQHEIGQARMIPNPEAEIGLENFGRNELEATVSQRVELGGKRKSRIAVAQGGGEIAEIEYTKKCLELETEAIRRFLPILASQRKIVLLDSTIVLARNTLELIQKRVEAGASLKIDAMRAEIELDELDMERTRFVKEQFLLKKALARLWADSAAAFEGVAGRMNTKLQLAPVAEYQNALRSHPDIMQYALKNRCAQDELTEVVASARPDIAISGGYLRNNETNDNAVLLGASIDLPLFNRNQGAVASKKVAIAAQKIEQAALVNERNGAISRTYEECALLTGQIAVLKQKVLPKAVAVFDGILDYYEKGSVSFLEVMEAQAELMRLNLEIVDREL